ncbi:MAG: PP2C family protein-serine/threonine phosphatase [Flavobacteriales bacterium]
MAIRSIKRADAKILIRDQKLGALLEITNAINSNLSKSKLFAIYEFVLREQLNIGKLVLFLNEGEWDMALKFGTDSDVDIDIRRDLLAITEITEVNSKVEGPFKEFDIVVPVYHKTKPLAYLLIGDVMEEALMVSPIIKHLPFVQTLTNIIAVAIENKNLVNDSLRQEGMRKELELASEMQAMLLPTSLPSNNHLDIAVFYQSHQQVGGDYYDFIELSEDEVCFCIADVSGKGVSAAMLMSNFQANLRALVHYSVTLCDLIDALNRKVLESAKGEKFITLFVAKYNIKTREMSYVNAGHNPPFLISEDISLLKAGCPGLGMLDEIPLITEGRITIPAGSSLFCYTDGLVETENEQNKEFGMEGLQESLENNRAKKPSEINTNVLNDLKVYKGRTNYADDIALLSCKFF